MLYILKLWGVGLLAESLLWVWSNKCEFIELLLIILALVPCVHMKILCCLVYIWFVIPTIGQGEFQKTEFSVFASIIPDKPSLMFIWFMGSKHWAMEVSLIMPLLTFRRCFNSSFPYMTSFKIPSGLVELVSQRSQFQVGKRSHRFIWNGCLLDHLGDLKTQIEVASLDCSSIFHCNFCLNRARRSALCKIVQSLLSGKYFPI